MFLLLRRTTSQFLKSIQGFRFLNTINLLKRTETPAKIQVHRLLQFLRYYSALMLKLKISLYSYRNKYPYEKANNLRI